jgi:SAM-dependent methyltransferase
MQPGLLSLLRCPACRGELAPDARGGDAMLPCRTCGRTVPIVGGIPRFVQAPEDPLSRRTQASFGYEWTHFTDWRQSGETNFNDYFEGVDLSSLRGGTVLDAGCGMGRHARQLAPYAARVVAVDFSLAIDQAARNVAELQNVDCIQADLLSLPLADGVFDYVYSLGVLHHVDATERALAGLVAKVKPGGRLRVFLYGKRHGWPGQLLKMVTLARRVTVRLPFSVLRAACAVLSAALYASIILPYRALSALGVRRHEHWPLFVYTKYPFNVIYNDQFDRFSAPLEKRYDAAEVKTLLEAAGLSNVQVRARFGWVAEGTKL